MTVITPHPRALHRILIVVGTLGIAANAAVIYRNVAIGKASYMHDYLPTQLLFIVFFVGYLVYLAKTLFPALSKGAVIRYDDESLEVTLEGKTRRVPWEAVQQIRFGDIYMKLEFEDGAIEVPFILRSEQRILYRLHFRKTGFTPDEGRFFEIRSGKQ